IDGEDGFVTIATTRPETILGDTAVCVNPNDPRYAHLKGKHVIVPLINRSVPIIYDDYVDMEFGTGALKVTPAHDINDYMLGEKHRLQSIDIFNDNGTLSPAAKLYVGMDRFEVRKVIVGDLEKAGNLAKVEDYVNKVGFSERTDAVIEPKLSMQWFLRMKELSQPALDSVINGDIELYPPKFVNTYRHWMENVKDWCLSRQLWWGHRIPAWYLPEGGYVVANTEEEALEFAKKETGNANLKISDLRQDEDVLDTWFSSWLWPISVFNGILEPNNKDIKYYYPTNDLITAPEILFFWVARMIIAGYEYMDEKPFRNVYLTGIVRDHLHRKMSKQLGNSPDPIDLMAKYGADGVRVGMLLCSPAGNDLLFDEALTEQGRNFCNKIWNAFRLVKGWQVDETVAQPESARAGVEWFNNQLNKAIEQADDDFDKYRISEALMNLYKLFWDEFSSWYLEIIKPAYGQPIDGKTYKATLEIFEKILSLLHPYMPFITEELWQHLRERNDGESIMVSLMPKSNGYDAKILEQFEKVKEIIAGVRTIRQEKNIAIKQQLSTSIRANSKFNGGNEAIIVKLAGLENLSYVDAKIDGAASFMVGNIEVYIPLEGLIDAAEEKAKLIEELNYTKGFLDSVMKKLSNERFVNSAPANVVDLERKKQADALDKIKTLEERISSLR
ncbi:MAG TPA: valine--tRNA ligase, partial [Tenuifilaceae bacterium]|nr:valine--tRNA ligase [Tenuifilaceae bacterium]